MLSGGKVCKGIAMRKSVTILSVSLFLGACQYSAPGDAETRSASIAPERSAAAGEAYEPSSVADFAQATCADCHSIEAVGLSPNPQAPTFAEIANRPGITRDTLVTYLTDAHNYPEAMDFELTPARSAALADYLLTLRDPDAESSD